ncbi:unnamed protein product [Hydatigera taeniaeformis]|uniref:Anoctamin n=1 Tax=Hydatigena taeniaeformis TaxID=6205 RepID=A0A0R3X526_HYDTA|nr:unnamed protein product [Hydatigera taeniaeformis]
MTAQSPDLNCALYLWRLQVYNDYNVTSMEGLLTYLKHTNNPSHRFIPPSLQPRQKNVSFADMYPPYENLGVLQGLMAIAIITADITMLLWIIGSVAFFWRAAFDDLSAFYCIKGEDKWSYFVDYRKEKDESKNEDTDLDDEHRREELLQRLEAIIITMQSSEKDPSVVYPVDKNEGKEERVELHGEMAPSESYQKGDLPGEVIPAIPLIPNSSEYTLARHCLLLSLLSHMGRKKHKQPRPSSKKANKKQMRKKQSAIVQRCIQALNSKTDNFRAKLSEPQKSLPKKPPNGSLKHFKPIRIELVERAALADAANLLESKFHLGDTNPPGQKENS